MKYKVFKVGGDPDNDFCLYENLKRLLNDLQHNGFEIVRIDYHEISRAWSIEGKYKKTSEYIIVATESEEYK